VKLKIVVLIAAALVCLAAGYWIGRRTPPGVAADVAPRETRLSILTLKYGELTIPCVVVNAAREVQSPSVSCGWTPEMVQTFTEKK
jgi:hypothetical protein